MFWKDASRTGQCSYEVTPRFCTKFQLSGVFLSSILGRIRFVYLQNLVYNQYLAGEKRKEEENCGADGNQVRHTLGIHTSIDDAIFC